MRSRNTTLREKSTQSKTHEKDILYRNRSTSRFLYKNILKEYLRRL